MSKFIAILWIVFTAISSTIAVSSSSIALINHTSTRIETQGGTLEFKSSVIQRFENSTNNRDTLVLRDYSGLPLKALQLKIIIINSSKLKLKSISRGSGIPTSSFLFDYQIYKGEINEDGSSVDLVSVVLLGNGTNVLYPKQSYDILTIEYDIPSIAKELDTTSIILTDVLGATCSPVQDALISIGEKKTILLKKQTPLSEIKIFLNQNYPNPFNPSTKINFRIVNDGFVELKIYNSIGEEVTTVLNEYKTAGEYEVEFNADHLSSGVYFYRVTSGILTDIKKMILIK